MTQYLCKISDIAEGGKEVCINAESGPVYVMLFPYAGTVRAYLNVCPHQGMPLNWAPDRFMFNGQGFLICAHHGARFDLDTGACMGGACRGASLQKVDISLDEDSVWLEQIPG